MSNMAKNKAASGDSTNFVIVTGLSGSGMSSATNAFEDLGFFCVDNLPLTMLSTFGRLLLPNEDGHVAIERAALVINIRERHFLVDFLDEIKKLGRKKLAPYVVFFEASDEVLQRRFSETRRPHPADKGKGLIPSIIVERKAMQKIRDTADLIVDTSDHTVHTLRRFILDKFANAADGARLRLMMVSFGHKYGVPRDLDFLFDVRHLPNPYFDARLRELGGDDPRVVKFLEKSADVTETIFRFSDLLTYLLPGIQREGKAYLTIGIGCTGGRHRSVMTANRLGAELAAAGYDVSVVHRDLHK